MTSRNAVVVGGNRTPFASNNRGNAYRIYLELEQSQFKDDKK